MKQYTRYKKWFSIVMAMGIMLFISLAAIYILEFIVPFGKNVKGIENASSSYYQANSGIEESLWFLSQSTTLWVQTSQGFGPSSKEFSYDVIGNGSVIPRGLEWDSLIDPNYNILSAWNPVQLEIWSNAITDWNTVDFYIRVPNTIWTWWPYNLTPQDGWIINWQLSSENFTLNSNGSTISASDIDDNDFTLGWKAWVYQNNFDVEESSSFQTFYSWNCWSGQSCILKLSIINDLIPSTWVTIIPHLEYRIDFNSSWLTPYTVPLRFTNIEASGKSFGFRKDLKVKVPQLTVDEAFDFTVLQ